jgi:hypothetical protein
VEEICEREFLCESQGIGLSIPTNVTEQDTHIARQEPVFTEDNLVNVEFRGQIGETLVKSGLVYGQAAVTWASGDQQYLNGFQRT